MKPQSERTAAAMNAFWVCLEELILAHKADKADEPKPPKPSRWKSFWTVFPLYAGILFGVVILLLGSFAVGRDYQKQYGPPGNECEAGSLRSSTQDHFAGECINEKLSSDTLEQATAARGELEKHRREHGC